MNNVCIAQVYIFFFFFFFFFLGGKEGVLKRHSYDHHNKRKTCNSKLRKMGNLRAKNL